MLVVITIYLGNVKSFAHQFAIDDLGTLTDSSIFFQSFKMSSSTQSSFPQDTEGKVARAKELKDEGNDLFKAKEYAKAKRAYYTAIAFIKGLPGRPASFSDPMGQMAAQNSGAEKMSNELATELDDLEAILKTNIATCFLKLNKGFDAITTANEALQVRSTSWKAMLRKAEGKLMVKDYEGSLKVLEEVERSSPDASATATIKKLRDDCQKGMKNEALKQKKTYSSAFSKFTYEDEKEFDRNN